jgi:hypothetical protein
LLLLLVVVVVVWCCRGYDNGHRGIWLERGQDNLITNFKVDTMMYHDLSVSFYEQNTVFANGTGKVSELL